MEVGGITPNVTKYIWHDSIVILFIIFDVSSQ